MRPSARQLRILFIWTILALLLSISRSWLDSTYTEFAILGWWAWGIFFALLSVLDIIWWTSSQNKQHIRAERIMSANFSLGSNNTIKIRLHNPFDYDLQVIVFDQYPEQLRVATFPVTVTLPAQGFGEIQYQAQAIRRGDANFGDIELRVRSRWRLWEFHHACQQKNFLRIYPNFSNISALTLLGHKQQVSQLGIHLQQRRGQGIDFHQLREYRLGDTLAQIDWKASAKHVKLISREYQDERDQDIVFLLDCGRRMRSMDEDYSHFDHALNAMLLTSYIALKQGDAVGLLTFAGQPRWISPIKGPAAINTLMNLVYDLHSSTRNSDILEAAEQLMSRHRKRALVIIISNILEEDRDDLIAATHLLAKQHLVMIASLREDFLDNNLQQPVTDFDSALRYSGTQLFLEQRGKVLRSLRDRGVVITDSLAKNMHINLANQFLKLKRSGRI